MPELNRLFDLLIKNSATSLLRYGVSIPILLAVTPYILHHLGPEAYGVWALFGVVSGYADLSDLGIDTAVIRFVAKYWAAGDDQAINYSVNTALVIYLTLGGIVMALILLGGRFLTAVVFKIPDIYANEAVFVIAGAAIAFFISLIFGLYGACVQAFQRMDLLNISLVGFTVLDSLGAVAVLALGYGLYGLVISRIFAGLVIGLLNYWMARRVMPALKVRLSDFSLQKGREIISYSLNILVSKISTMVRDPLNKTIILRLTSLSSMAFYDLGGRIANQARGLFGAMLGPLLPASSGIQTLGGAQAIRRLYNRSIRYLVLAVLPVFGGLIVLAKPFIAIWIGPQYGQVVWTLQALLVAYFFVLLASPAFTIMEGIGLARVSATTSIITSLLNVVLSVGFGIQWGYLGVLIGYCLSLVIGSVVTQTLFHRRMAVSIIETLQAIPLRAMLVDGCAILAAWMLVAFTGMQGIGVLMVSGGAYLVICIFGTFAFGCLEKEEIDTMKRLLLVFAK